jgi:hypothetical protein
MGVWNENDEERKEERKEKKRIRPNGEGNNEVILNKRKE